MTRTEKGDVSGSMVYKTLLEAYFRSEHTLSLSISEVRLVTLRGNKACHSYSILLNK